MRRIDKQIKAGVLATVIVVAVLLLIGVMGLISLWTADTVLFTRANYMQTQRDNIESAFTLYRNNPEIILEADSTIMLYDSLPQSRVKIESRTWGLYEIVSVTNTSSKIHQSRMIGSAEYSDIDCNFWYRNNRSSLTVTGNTNIHGQLMVPRNGIVYGQMKSIFFNGEKIELSRIGVSKDKIPQPMSSVETSIRRLDELPPGEFPLDSVSHGFYSQEPLVFDFGSGQLSDCTFRGNIILKGDQLYIDASCRLDNIIIMANSVTIGENFRGSLQIFAKDSVVVKPNTALNYPSGIYATRYVDIADNAEINGYVIVRAKEKNVKHANYKQSRLAKVRGLLYVDGIAQLQGIVNGMAILHEAAYYSSQGYYRDMIFDASVLENRAIAYPLWLKSTSKRKEAKCVD